MKSRAKNILALMLTLSMSISSLAPAVTAEAASAEPLQAVEENDEAAQTENAEEAAVCEIDAQEETAEEASEAADPEIPEESSDVFAEPEVTEEEKLTVMPAEVTESQKFMGTAEETDTQAVTTKEMTMYIGETLYLSGDLSNNSDVIKTEKQGEAEKTFFGEVTSGNIESGKQYLIVNSQNDAIVTSNFKNTDKDLEFYTDGVALKSGTCETDYSAYLWTFTETSEEGYYTISNPNNQYMSMEGGNLKVVTLEEDAAAPVFLIDDIEVGSSKGCSIQEKGSSRWLNNYGGNDKKSHATVYGSNNTVWHLYQYFSGEVTAVTAQKFGQTTLQAGEVNYQITVKEAKNTYCDVVYLREGDETTLDVQGSYDAGIELNVQDDSVVSAEKKANGSKVQVTFTAQGRGKTVVDAGPTRYYVYVLAEDQALEEEITIYPGQIKRLQYEGKESAGVSWEGDYDNILTVTQSTQTYLPGIWGDSVTSCKGINNFYVGTMQNLNECLYTFTATDNAEDTYVISGKGEGGSAVYLNHQSGNAGAVNSSTSLDITVEAAKVSGDFYLSGFGGNTKRYIWFYSEGAHTSNNKFDRSKNYDAVYSVFHIYRPAVENEESSTELPGFVKVTEVSGIESGKQYLIVASYRVEGKVYYYAICPKGTSGHRQTVQIVNDVNLQNTLSTVELTGKAAGTTTLTLGNRTYKITVLDREQDGKLTVDSTPFIANTGVGKNDPVTSIAMSSGLEFGLRIGNGYEGAVTWSVEITGGYDSEGKPVADYSNHGITIVNGVLKGDGSNSTTTYVGNVVANINDVYYKIPLNMSPSPKNGITEENARLHDVYVENIEHTEVWYGWLFYRGQDESAQPVYDYTKELTKAEEGLVIYTSTPKAGGAGLDFFAKAENGYALTSMLSSNAAGHYMRLETEKAEDTEFCRSGVKYLNDKGEVTSVSAAGRNQRSIQGAETAVLALVQTAMDNYKCKGAQGFTRVPNEGGQNNRVGFRSEKLPEVTKEVMGVQSEARGFHEYIEGMAATSGEQIIFKITVNTFEHQEKIVYSNVILKELLEGAEFYVPTNGTMPAETGQDSSVQRVLTEAINKAEESNEAASLEYYALYTIQPGDISSDALKYITNTVQLDYDYRTRFQIDSDKSSANAKAAVLLADKVEGNIVVDFGLPVTITNYVAKDSQDYYHQATNGPVKTPYGQVEVKIEENNNDGSKKVITTYTPESVFHGNDTVTLIDINDKDNTTQTNIFYVYPATSVYYEEGYASYDTKWTIGTNEKSGEQQLQLLQRSDEEKATYAQFGYDAKYAAESAGPSNNTEAVSTKAGDKAEFTFTGTGVDIYANCNGGEEQTGSISVLIKDSNGKIKKLMIVNTCVAGSETAGDASASQNDMGASYNLPVVSVGDLKHDKYTVYIRHTKTKDEVDTIYPVKLDGFRVYNTLQDQTVYEEFKEADPKFLEVRNGVLNALDLDDILKNETSTEGSDGASGGTSTDTANKSIYAEDIAKGLKQVYDQAEGNSSVYGEGKALIVTASGADITNMEDLLDNGPKNEVFLYKDQSLVLKLNGGLENVQIGLKAVNAAVQMSIKKTVGNNEETLTTPTWITSSTDMFYKLGDITAATTITITNAGDGVLSITDLKYFGAPSDGTETASVFARLSEEDFIPALKTMGYATKAETTPDGGNGTTPDGGNETTPDGGNGTTPDGGNETTPEEKGVTRVYGADRYATAYAVADTLKEQLGIEKYETILVATGKGFADALSGSYLAVKEKAPILLTDGSQKANEQLTAYLEKNAAEEAVIYILGGEKAVSKDVMDLLEEAEYAVERLGGASRYETNLNILKKAGIDGKEIIVATGKDFADSLSVSATGKPVLLVADTLNAAQKELLRAVSGGNIYIAGGEKAVSAAIEEELNDFGTVKRVAGNNRYETSVEVAKSFFADAKEAVLANASKAYDGLCGGPLAAAMNLPLILTKDGKTDAAAAYAQQKNMTSGYVLGGGNALEDQTVKDIFGADQIKEFVYESEK